MNRSTNSDHRNTLRTAVVIVALTTAIFAARPAVAQSQPGSTATAAGLPQVQKSAPDATGAGAVGTNVIGDQDSSVGLFVTPWKRAPEPDVDRVPHLYDVPPGPIDTKALRARARLDDEIEAYRITRLQGGE